MTETAEVAIEAVVLGGILLTVLGIDVDKYLSSRDKVFGLGEKSLTVAIMEARIEVTEGLLPLLIGLSHQNAGLATYQDLAWLRFSQSRSGATP